MLCGLEEVLNALCVPGEREGGPENDARPGSVGEEPPLHGQFAQLIDFRAVRVPLMAGLQLAGQTLTRLVRSGRRTR